MINIVLVDMSKASVLPSEVLIHNPEAKPKYSLVWVYSGFIENAVTIAKNLQNAIPGSQTKLVSSLDEYTKGLKKKERCPTCNGVKGRKLNPNKPMSSFNRCDTCGGN